MTTTQHPLTETDAAGLWDGYLSDDYGVWHRQDYTRKARAVDALRAAFDAGREHERESTPLADPHHDPRPWGPLHGPAHVGDEVLQDHNGVTTTGVVGRVDVNGDPWTTEGRFIGVLEYGTWHVRRTAQELPTEPEAVIVTNAGHDYIEAVVGGETWRTREAILSWGRSWHAVWRSGNRTRVGVYPDHITPGTWKKGNR